MQNQRSSFTVDSRVECNSVFCNGVFLEFIVSKNLTIGIPMSCENRNSIRAMYT